MFLETYLIKRLLKRIGQLLDFVEEEWAARGLLMRLKGMERKVDLEDRELMKYELMAYELINPYKTLGLSFYFKKEPAYQHACRVTIVFPHGQKSTSEVAPTYEQAFQTILVKMVRFGIENYLELNNTKYIQASATDQDVDLSTFSYSPLGYIPSSLTNSNAWKDLPKNSYY